MDFSSFAVYCPLAVWNKNETLSFYLDPSNKTKHAGSSLFKTWFHKGSAIEIQGFDTSLWLKNTVRRNDFVLFKMDIEGAEYKVLEKMIEDGTILLIDHLVVEWHCAHTYKFCGGLSFSQRMKVKRQTSRIIKQSGSVLVSWH
uniref:Methyltransferase FkbM domain-containing protein n=1 Tax=Tetraselmis sp. GSL018 TaxID=582737 RepID=A0A061RWG1_9CHLO|mmetsp:Transcript_42660/g.101289  ORF Transcript_42660/g.101289 Transcript_42660/m.101289 type:complete len:143 (-) Transcript_42660:215-643(-)